MRTSPSESSPFTGRYIPEAFADTVWADPRIMAAMAKEPVMADDPSITLDIAAELSPEESLNLATILWGAEPTRVESITDSVHEEVRAQLSSIVDSASQQLLHMNHARIAKGITTRHGIHPDVLKVADELKTTVRSLIFSDVVGNSMANEQVLEKKIFEAAYEAADLYTVAEVSEEVKNNIDRVRALIRYVANFVTEQVLDEPAVTRRLQQVEAKAQVWGADLDSEMARFADTQEVSSYTHFGFEPQTAVAQSNVVAHKAVDSDEYVAGAMNSIRVPSNKLPLYPKSLKHIQAQYVCSKPECPECNAWMNA